MTEYDDYTPRFYVAPRAPNAAIDLTRLRTVYERHLDVVATEVVARRPRFRREQNRDDPDEERLEELEGRSGTLKWIPVACFGYQGLTTRSSGESSVIEAINVFACEILLSRQGHHGIY